MAEFEILPNRAVTFDGFDACFATFEELQTRPVTELCAISSWVNNKSMSSLAR